MLVSQREFASQCGVTEGAVSRACKAGRLLQMKGKLIETGHPLSVEFAGRHRSKVGKTTVAMKQKASRSPRGGQNVTNIIAETANVGVGAESLNQGNVDLNDRKKLADIAKTELETAIMRHRYIEREMVGQWIMRFYGTMSSVWRSMSGRVMPDMVAKIRSSANDDDALRDGSKLIDDAIYEGLEQIRDVMLTFGKNIPQLVVMKDEGNGNGKPHS